MPQNNDHNDDDRIRTLASKQSEWRNLPRTDKAALLQDMLDILAAMDVEDLVCRLGEPDAMVNGFRATERQRLSSNANTEAAMEAAQSTALYSIVVTSTVQRLLVAYQQAVAKDKNIANKSKTVTLPVTKHASSGRVRVQTLPILSSDTMGPLAKSSGYVWLNDSVTTVDQARTFDLDAFAEHNDKDANKCMIVLGAGNHLFLSVVDILFGLFQSHRVVYCKHHALRGPHHDPIVREILAPLVARGYFDSEVDTGSLQRSQAIVYHPDVAHVHLTGGKPTHDAIVWGHTKDRTKPVLQARMTSELGCVTPWIVAAAPDNQWTLDQLEHQVQHLYAALYSNAGANCNSPKVVLLPDTWEHKITFVKRLTELLDTRPVPVSYYPGARHRWNGFRKAYPKARELGDTTTAKDRTLAVHNNDDTPSTPQLLPWLLVDVGLVDISTAAGRAQASSEYAFATEPFAPVVTLAYYAGGRLGNAVQVANHYMFGSLSCTLVAPDTDAPDVQNAVAELRYGSVCLNMWSALGYTATGCTWGAFPGERLDSVESGIGQVNNCFFIANAEKSVVTTPVVDAFHPVQKEHETMRKEYTAIASLSLKPGLYRLLNLISVSTTGLELPKDPPIVWMICGAAVAVGGLGALVMRPPFGGAIE